MKKSIATMVLSVFTALVLNAYTTQSNSKLELRLWDNSFFSIEIDSKSYPANVTEFSMNNLRPGQHYIKVIKRTQRPNGFIAQVMFEGYVQIPARTQVEAKITRSHQFDVIRLRPLSTNHPTQGHNSHGQGTNGHGQGHNSHGQGYNSYGASGVNGYYGESSAYYPTFMTEASFSQLKFTIGHISFDSKKLEVAKQAIAINNVSSEQVLELMQMLSFDSYRLDLAKYAYSYTIDKHNYYIVNNAFTFSSNITALNQYILSYPM